MQASPQPEQSTLPRHVAIIMDGNGRWATGRNLPRLEGHRAGAKSVRTVVEECRKLGIRYLTLFSFSTENWQRSRDEVSGLMELFEYYLDSELENLLENGIRLRAVGDLERLPLPVQRALQRNMARTEQNSALDLILAISYGGREEILAATKDIARRLQAGELTMEQITVQEFSRALWTTEIPDPDLLIRTSGEMRISNFLLWQLAYSEIVVTPELWPDFDAQSLNRCLNQYQQRERRFGLTTEQLPGYTGSLNGTQVNHER